LLLLVDDDVDNLALIGALLQHEGYRVMQAESAETAAEILCSHVPDLILLDINMPGLSGLDLLADIRKKEPYIAVIFVSARSETQDVVRGLDAGADDYVCKPFEPVELLARVRAQLRIKDIKDQLSAANAKLQELVDIDDLTGLFNMRSIYQRLEGEIARCKRYSRAIGVIMLDMDHFKTVNDTNDHLFGSFVLAEVGKLIKGSIRQVDFAARYGGDEFLIALSETSVDGARRFAERLLKVIAAYEFVKDGNRMHLTASMGVCVGAPSLADVDARSLVRAADHALYEAKHAGRNCIKVYDPVRLMAERKTS
jgi:diguanylate cyclase (GGDEF)-like protein